MMRAVFITVLLLGLASPAGAERVWLVIGASDPSPAGIVRKARPLILQIPHSLVVQTSDCGDTKNMFAWVAEITDSFSAAQTGRSRIRKSVQDAYVKSCNIRPGTLLAVRISAVDPSIAKVPTTAVNWQDEDRISSARQLPDGRTFVIIRYFSEEEDDPLEGRRERVIISESPGKYLILEENCLGPGGVVINKRDLAFHCVREQAGDHLLHSVVVFNGGGKKQMEIQHCRNAQWSGDHLISCEEELVGPDGRLNLHTKTVELTSKEMR